jgi:putative phosphoesterase
MPNHTLGVISDTHGLLDAKIPALFQGVSHILHAGDVGRPSVLAGLRAIAPVTVVSGNVDGFVAGIHPECLQEYWGVRIWMLHILGDPFRLPANARELLKIHHPDVVVFGHSHQSFMERIDGRLFFNPGSAGPKRFSLPRSVGFLELEGGKVRGRIVLL